MRIVKWEITTVKCLNFNIIVKGENLDMVEGLK